MIRHPLLMSLALIGVMLAASAFALTQVPADAQIAVHFDVNGRPDRFAGPWLAFLVLPGLALAATGSRCWRASWFERPNSAGPVRLLFDLQQGRRKAAAHTITRWSSDHTPTPPSAGDTP